MRPSTLITWPNFVHPCMDRNLAYSDSSSKIDRSLRKEMFDFLFPSNFVCSKLFILKYTFKLEIFEIFYEKSLSEQRIHKVPQILFKLKAALVSIELIDHCLNPDSDRF